MDTFSFQDALRQFACAGDDKGWWLVYRGGSSEREAIEGWCFRRSSFRGDVRSSNRVHSVHEHAPFLQHGGIFLIEGREPVEGEGHGRPQRYGTQRRSGAILLLQQVVNPVKAGPPVGHRSERHVDDLETWLRDDSTGIRGNPGDERVVAMWVVDHGGLF